MKCKAQSSNRSTSSDSWIYKAFDKAYKKCTNAHGFFLSFDNMPKYLSFRIQFDYRLLRINGTFILFNLTSVIAFNVPDDVWKTLYLKSKSTHSKMSVAELKPGMETEVLTIQKY